MSLVLIPDGPGTTVEVRDGQQGLPPAPRGTAAILGQFSSGPVTYAALAVSPAQARLFSGDPDDSFEASLAASDVYSLDTPPMLIGRVTDGNEVKSRSNLWDRKPSRSISKTSSDINADRAPLATALANNGGRWGGAKRVVVGDVNSIASDLTSTTLDISTASETPAAGAFLVDLYKGAEITLEGDTGGPYEITGNDDQGVLTIKGEFSQAAQDASGAGAIDGQFRITLSSQKELSVVIAQDSVTKQRFSLNGLRKFKLDSDWEQVTSYSNLGLSSNDDLPWLTTIEETELDRYQIEISTSYTGETVEEKLPANFCEVPTSVSGATLTYQWYRWSAGSANTGSPYVGTIAAVDTSLIEPHVYDLVFTAPTTFDVTVTWPDGTTQPLGSGTLGTPFSPAHPQLSSFTATAGAVAAVVSDTLKIRIDPLPADLSTREAFIYPVAVSSDGNTNQRLRISSNTYNTVTIRSDLELSTFGSSAGASAKVTTADLSLVSLAVGNTVILTPDGGTTVTLTSAGSGPGAVAIAAELDGLDTDSIFVFTVVGNTIEITVNGSYGARSEIELGAGTGHVSLGIATTGSVFGSDGVPFRIEARWPMWGGYDGVAPAAVRYLLAMDIEDNLFKRWLCTNLGLVRVATPGITDTSVKTAARELVAKNGWKYFAEFSSSFESQALPGEAAIADMLANEVESDYVDHVFPSRAKFLSVDRTKTVVRSVAGMFLGLKAKMSNVGVDGEKGFHIATANNNVQGRLSPRVIGLSDDIGRWTPPKKLLNDHGIVAILWEGPSVYLWGNRMYSAGRTPRGSRYTITERDVYYHIARDLFVTSRPFIFKSISARRLAEVQLSLREKMKVYFNDGFFSDVAGPGFEQQVSVLVPPDLNPPEDLLEGKVTASIQFRPRPALEDLKIIISPSQLSSEG